MGKEQKIIVVLGPTASGKSALAVHLAKKFGGEVISADSRQIYRGVDVGTGKITKEEMDGVPHHLLDVADVDEQFSAADFKRLAEAALADISNRGLLPIIAGGTGFYIQTLIDNISIPEVPPNEGLREKLSERTPEELLKMLVRMDPKRVETIDPNNPRRLIRAIEIAETLGKVPEIKDEESKYDALQIGIDIPSDDLKEKIEKRVKSRLTSGMIEEAKNISLERLRELGLGYKCLADFFEKKIDRDGLAECVIKEEQKYAKRQMTWFKRDQRIKWFSPNQKEEIEKEVKKFLQ